MRVKLLFICFLLLCATILPLNSDLTEYKQELLLRTEHDYVMPPLFVKLTALDFRGLMADFQLLDAINFIGNKTQQQQPITKQEWDYFIDIILSVTELDPRFYDPYYFSGALLAWGPKRFDDALFILERGMHERENDFHIPFVMSFIYFYFKNEPRKGAELLQIAANRPGAPKTFFAKLSARLAFYSGDQQLGISFLNMMIQNEKNPSINLMYSKRKIALENSLIVEDAVRLHKEKHGEFPNSIDQLISADFLKEVPIEPYGGNWIILKNGRVYSSSNFTDK